MADEEDTRIQSTHLNPPTTVTTADDITRADYHRWMVEEDHYELANETRAERQDRRAFRAAQKAAQVEYGKELGEMQKQQQANTMAAREGMRQEHAQLGAEARADLEAKRVERAELKESWAEHGRQLVEQYRGGVVKQSRDEMLASKRAIVQEVKEQMAKFEKGIDARKDDKVNEKHTQVGKIKEDTADTITRAAKKLFVDERWDIADGMREDLEAMRQERQENEAAYVERARQIAAKTSNEPARTARKQMYEKRLSDAKRIRSHRQQIEGSDQDQKQAAAVAKQAVHASIHSAKFVPMSQVKASPDRLKPYFSFRNPQRLTTKKGKEVKL